jgi:hypothetical protein
MLSSSRHRYSESFKDRGLYIQYSSNLSRVSSKSRLWHSMKIWLKQKKLIQNQKLFNSQMSSFTQKICIRSYWTRYSDEFHAYDFCLGKGIWHTEFILSQMFWKTSIKIKQLQNQTYGCNANLILPLLIKENMGVQRSY